MQLMALREAVYRANGALPAEGLVTWTGGPAWSRDVTVPPPTRRPTSTSTRTVPT